MARIRKRLSPRGRGRRVLVPDGAEEPSRGGGLVAPPHFAGTSSPSPSPSLLSPQPPSSLSPQPPSSSQQSPRSLSPSPLQSSSSQTPPLLTWPRSSSPSSSSPWPSSSSSSEHARASSEEAKELATRPIAGEDGDLAGASPGAPAPAMAPSAEEAASRALFASEDAVLQLMDLAEKEEGSHHKGKAPLVEGVDQNFVKALVVEGVDQNFVKAPLVEGVDQISIEKNLSVPINAVEEDTICGALMSLRSLTTITLDGSNHRISSTDRDDASRQQLALLAEEANKMPCIGDKEPLSALASDFPSDSFVIQEKIKFCMEEVIKMGSEVDRLQITALADALGVPVSLLNINSSPTLSSSGTLEANRHDFSPHSSLRNQPPPNGATTTSRPDVNSPSNETGEPNANDVAVAASNPSPVVSTGDSGASMSNASARRRPHATLLYRPGHYDILFIPGQDFLKDTIF